MSSLGIMLYLLGRALPRVAESEKSRLRDVIYDFSKKIPLEKIDFALNKIFEKILRRIKVGILKIDNLVSSYLGKVKENNKADNDNQSTLFDRKP